MKPNKWIVILFTIFTPMPAMAYLDPGTGSMLLQVILGGIAAIGVAVKLFWHKIRIFLGLSQRAQIEDD